MNDPRLWFVLRRSGLGYSPRTWEGWVAAAALFATAVLAWAMGVFR